MDRFMMTTHTTLSAVTLDGRKDRPPVISQVTSHKLRVTNF